MGCRHAIHARLLRRHGPPSAWATASIPNGRSPRARPATRRSPSRSPRPSSPRPRRSAARTRRAEAEGFYALALANAGRGAEALPRFQNAIPILLDPSHDLNGDGKAFLRRKISLIIEGYLAIQHKAGLLHGGDTKDAALDQAFRYVDELRNGSVQEALSASATRMAATVPAIAGLIRDEQDTGLLVENLYCTLAELYDRLPEKEANAEAGRLRRQIEDADSRRKSLQRDIAGKFPDYDALVHPRAPTLAAIAAKLAPQEAFVSIYISADATYIRGVSAKGQVAFLRSTLNEKQVAQAVDRLRASLDPGDVPLKKIPPVDLDRAYLLYKELLLPLKQAWSGDERLVVYTSGALTRPPLALLVTGESKVQPDRRLLFSEYKNMPWLSREIATAYVPTGTAFLSLLNLPAGNASRKVF
ncbi:MAG: hypothetical protein MO853_12285 [Candidatus Protistobacter heckmanni]|nr:hypothetical protein [Candidatus Protistobacter heckmanni]